jgi:hypothetical protein
MLLFLVLLSSILALCLIFSISWQVILAKRYAIVVQALTAALDVVEKADDYLHFMCNASNAENPRIRISALTEDDRDMHANRPSANPGVLCRSRARP